MYPLDFRQVMSYTLGPDGFRRTISVSISSFRLLLRNGTDAKCTTISFCIHKSKKLAVLSGEVKAKPRGEWMRLC
jgi:hypothetical protein